MVTLKESVKKTRYLE